MATVDFTDAEHAAVTRAVRRTIDEDRYPLAPRIAPLGSALAKLDPASAPKPIEPRPPLPIGPSVGNWRGKARLSVARAGHGNRYVQLIARRACAALNAISLMYFRAF